MAAIRGGRLIECVKQLQMFHIASPCARTILLPTERLTNVRHHKHYNPKFKKLRALKFVSVEIPKFDEKEGDLSEEEIRSRMKARGILPPRPWLERPFFIASTGGTFEPYVPPEGDGKRSAITTVGAKQKFDFIQKKSKSMMAIRKIRNYEEDFDHSKFAEVAQDIYVKSHEALCTKDKYRLRELVTERVYPEMMHNIHGKTIHWKFIKSLEPPRVVHARCTEIVTSENVFAQVTVRFHTQQLLAIYDRFGRLMHGSETLVKDVLEYIVFEKQIVNEYGVWRLHEKIIPDWMPPKEPSSLTYRIVDEPEKPVDPIPADEVSKAVEVKQPGAEAAVA
ncbi:putative 39S ribosomal protein L45, mitochondrial [Pseudolycoriella hygida]|uniref:Large ribosomal subunit protein mL45 n=1 Tax=Pseudolycoriella hygida TaxID=35572 RepID=A0A9Q0RV03_9DIPT|nr:putative 39S ribosomal protein L45, mitochondrial [Pseudolycoriella hygida]